MQQHRPQYGYWFMLTVVVLIAVVLPIVVALFTGCDDCRLPWWP